MAEHKTVTATTLRVHLGEVLDELERSQEAIVVERGGREMAAVVPIDEYRRLKRPRLTAEWWEERDRIAADVAKRLAGRPYPDIDELINTSQR